MKDEKTPAQFSDCGLKLENDIIALARGTLRDAARAEYLRKHFLECRFCREFYADCRLEEQEAPGERKKTVPEIVLSVVEGMLRPLTGTQADFAPAYTLSGNEDSSRCSFTLSRDDFPADLDVSKAGNEFAVELRSASGKTAYLIQGNEMRSEPVRGGAAVFDRVSAGRYIVSVDMRQFVSVDISKS